MWKRLRLRGIIRREQCHAITEKYASDAKIHAIGRGLFNGDNRAIRQYSVFGQWTKTHNVAAVRHIGERVDVDGQIELILPRRTRAGDGIVRCVTMRIVS